MKYDTLYMKRKTNYRKTLEKLEKNIFILIFSILKQNFRKIFLYNYDN